MPREAMAWHLLAFIIATLHRADSTSNRVILQSLGGEGLEHTLKTGVCLPVTTGGLLHLETRHERRTLLYSITSTALGMSLNIITIIISYNFTCVLYTRSLYHRRDDLVEACVDQVEDAFSEYIAGTNGNPLVIDTVSRLNAKCVEG